MLLAIVGVGLSVGLAWALSIKVYAICAAAMAIYVLGVFVHVGDSVAKGIRDKLMSERLVVETMKPLSIGDWLATSMISIAFGALWPLVILIRIRQWQVERMFSGDDDDEP